MNIWYSHAKVLKNGLKLRDFGHGGVHRSGWWTSLFCVFDAADRMTIGANKTIKFGIGRFASYVFLIL